MLLQIPGLPLILCSAFLPLYPVDHVIESKNTSSVEQGTRKGKKKVFPLQILVMRSACLEEVRTLTAMTKADFITISFGFFFSFGGGGSYVITFK